ncbi:MAG: ureidoglycolate lyase [Xanthomonadales bacterium]|nr:ureidoglycolate lyase [Xanthomonadales bacterium]
MSEPRLQIEPLTPEAFAPFGEVISFEAAREIFPINNGTTQRHHALVRVDVGEGHALISLARAEPRPLPFAVTLLERHPLGSQAFIPLSRTPYLIVVAESPQHPPRCFLAANGEGVNYHAGTWHHPLIALDTVSDFVIIDRGGEGANCDEINLVQTWWIMPLASLQLPLAGETS